MASLKREQIMCAKKLCYINSVKFGTSPKVCADAYDVHICLYVEGALSKLLGNMFDDWLKSFLKQLGYNLIYQVAIFLVYTLWCYPYYTPSGSGATQYCQQPMETGGGMSVYCGLMMSALSIYETAQTINEMSKDGYWEDWWKDVETNADYCSQADDAEEGLVI